MLDAGILHGEVYDLNPSDIKVRIDRILQHNDHHLQGSYIPANSHCIIYHFLDVNSVTALTNTPTHPSSSTTAHIILIAHITSSPPMAWKLQSLVSENFQVFELSLTTTLNVRSPLADSLNQLLAEAVSPWMILFTVSSLALLRLLSASSPARMISNLLVTLQLYMTNPNMSTHSTPPASFCFSALAPTPPSLPNNLTMSFSNSFASQTPALLPPKPVPLLSASVCDAAPSSGHKRPRLKAEDSLEENQVQEMVVSIEVDQQVRSILSSLSNFFEILSTLLDESAACVDLLLKGFHDHALPNCPKKSYLTPSFFFTLLFSPLIVYHYPLYLSFSFHCSCFSSFPLVACILLFAYHVDSNVKIRLVTAMHMQWPTTTSK
jgi:hypothetical protein